MDTKNTIWNESGVEDTMTQNEAESTKLGDAITHERLLFALAIALMLVIPNEDAQAASFHIKDYLSPEVVDWLEYFETLFRTHPILIWIISAVGWFSVNELRHFMQKRQLEKKISMENVQASYTTIHPDGKLIIEEESGAHIDTMFRKWEAEQRLVMKAVGNVSPDNVILDIERNADEIIIGAIHTQTISSLSWQAGVHSAKMVLWKKWIPVAFIWVLTFEPRYDHHTGKVFERGSGGTPTKQQIRYEIFPKVQFDQVKEMIKEFGTQEGLSFEQVLDKVSENDSVYSDTKIEKILAKLFKMPEDNTTITDIVQSGKLKRNVDRKRILVMIHAIRHQNRGRFLKEFDDTVYES